MTSDTRDLFNGHLRDLTATLDLFEQHVLRHAEDNPVTRWEIDTLRTAIEDARLALATACCAECWESHSRLRLPGWWAVCGDLCEDCAFERAAERSF